MRHRMCRTILVVWAVFRMNAAFGQGPTDGLSSPTARGVLPFGTGPDRLSGPPRAMGELPSGFSQPPSTLPGRFPGQSPRAMGETPSLPPVFPPRGPSLPRVPVGVPAGETTAPLSTFAPGSPIRLTVPPRTPRDPSAQPDSGDETGDRGLDLQPVAPNIPQGSGQPLSLEEVLFCAEKGYPPFLAVLQERNIARGELLFNQGSFDTNFNSDSRNWPLGYYNRSVQDVFIEQPLKDFGGKVFSGYRIAQGNWPTYYNYLNTRSGGAFVAGLELPLLKNRAIDAKRAKLIQSEIERQKVEPGIAKQRIDLFKNASKAYWVWVAAGQSAVIYRDLLRVAELRNKGLEDQSREGLVRSIDLVDFRKILITRQQQVVSARRRVEQTAIELSLYLRDKYGLPLIPKPERLPKAELRIPALEASRFSEDFQVALRLRPEILSLRYLAQKAQIDRDFAVNQLQPSLSLYIYTEQNVGNRAQALGTDFRPFIMETSLLFDVPLQRRAAKGKIVAADAVLRQLTAQGQFLGDRIRADVLDGQSALLASEELLAQARDNLDVSRKLEDAERTLLREGSSNVLFLNLREQAASDAKVYVIEAEAKYLSTLADYRGTLGLDAMPAAPLR